MSKVLQRHRVLQYMKENGSITRMTAVIDIGCHELPARIVELQKEGYKIKKKNETGKNRYGDPTHWTRCTLA